jgi:hypothetical protein
VCGVAEALPELRPYVRRDDGRSAFSIGVVEVREKAVREKKTNSDPSLTGESAQ